MLADIENDTVQIYLLEKYSSRRITNYFVRGDGINHEINKFRNL